MLLFLLCLLSISVLGNKFTFTFTDNFKLFDGTYEITIDPPGKKDTLKFEFEMSGGKIVKLTNNKVAKVNGEGSLVVDVTKQCKRFIKVAAGASIGVPVIGIILPMFEVRCKDKSGKLSGSSDSQYFFVEDKPCKDHTFEIAAPLEKETVPSKYGRNLIKLVETGRMKPKLSLKKVS